MAEIRHLGSWRCSARRTWLIALVRTSQTRLTVFCKAFNNLSAISLDHLSVSSRHTRASNENTFMSLPVRTDAFKYSFLSSGHYRLKFPNPSHWMFASHSWFSLSMEVCWARHTPIIADHHDTPAVTGGLHPLLDISPKRPKCKNAIFSKTKQIRFTVSIDDW